MNMPIDLLGVMITVVICVVVLIDTLVKIKQWVSYDQSFHYLWRGLLLLLVGTIFNNLVEGRWDANYVISFLSLKIVGRWWLFRVFVSFAYIYIALGIEIMLIVKTKKIQEQKK